MLRLNNFSEADSTLLKFLDLYPESNYADEARLTLSKGLLRRKGLFKYI